MSLSADSELQQLAEALGQQLLAARERLVTAESCTGGWIAKAVTDVAGSSHWFDCGMAAYSYEAKQALLGVRPQTLEVHGAVSRDTVIEMVSGALVNSGASIAVAVTGIAGPGGGSDDKPVGTVWIGWKRRGGYATAQLFHFNGDRDAVRRQTVAAALRGLSALLLTSRRFAGWRSASHSWCAPFQRDIARHRNRSAETGAACPRKPIGRASSTSHCSPLRRTHFEARRAALV